MLEQSTSTHRIDGNPTCLRALHPPFRLLWLVTAFSTMFLAFVSIPHAFIISMVSNLTTRWAGNRANVRRCLGQAFVSSTRTCVIYKHGLLSRVKVFLYFIETQRFLRTLYSKCKIYHWFTGHLLLDLSMQNSRFL